MTGNTFSTPEFCPLDAYTLTELHARRSVKWTHYEPDVLPMWVAEMDSSTVPQVSQVVTQILVAGDTGYPGRYTAPAVPAMRAESAPQNPAHGTPGSLQQNPAHPNPQHFQISHAHEADYRLLPSYPDAYARFALERWGWEIDTDQIRLMPDVMQGVKHAVAMLNLKKLVINTPVYPPFRVYPVEAGASISEAKLTQDGRIDFDELARLFPEADGYLLCNPHNPTGVAHTREELERVFALADEHDVRVIVDEIHAPLTSLVALDGGEYADPYVPALSVAGSERGVVLFSAAKGFNLAGFKAALIIVGPDAIDDLKGVPETVFEGASALSIAAHTAALVYGGEWLDSVRAGIDRRRAQWVDGLAKIAPEVRVLPARATYFGWTDFSRVETHHQLLGDDPAKFLLRKARVAFNPGVDFGSGGQGFVRVNLATSAEVVNEALRRIASVIGNH